MEFNFANPQDLFISRGLIFARLDFPRQKHWWNKLKSLFLYSYKQKMTKNIWKLCLVGINFRESVKRFFLRPFNFANWGVICEIREIFWTRESLTLKYSNENFTKTNPWKQQLIFDFDQTTTYTLDRNIKFFNPQNPLKMIKSYLLLLWLLSKHLSERSVAPPHKCFPIAKMFDIPPLSFTSASTLSEV